MTSLLQPGSPRKNQVMRRRKGATLFWLIVLFGIVATLMALSIPALMTYDRLARVERTQEMLEVLRLAIFNSGASATETVFRQRVQNNPGRLSQLIEPIFRNDAVNYPDGCSTAFANNDETRWRAWGPFLDFAFDPAVGLTTPMGIFENNLVRETPGGAVVLLTALMPDADLDEILMLDAIYDTPANAGPTAGLVRWDNIVGESARFRFTMTIDGVC